MSLKQMRFQVTSKLIRPNSWITQTVRQRINCWARNGVSTSAESAATDDISDISVGHPLRKTSARAEHRPMIVHFTNCKARAMVLMQKKKLREAKLNIFIGEYLSKYVSDLFTAARNKVKNKKLSGAWTRNGKLFIKENRSGAVKHIKSCVDLQQC